MVAGLLACGGNDPAAPQPIADPGFAVDIQPILTRSCATSGVCHLGPTPQLGLDLSAGQAYGNLVNVASVLDPVLERVLPARPDSSFLILMMESDATKRGGGRRMPLGAAPLPAAVIQTMRNWIANGAADN